MSPTRAAVLRTVATGACYGVVGCLFLFVLHFDVAAIFSSLIEFVAIVGLSIVLFVAADYVVKPGALYTVWGGCYGVVSGVVGYMHRYGWHATSVSVGRFVGHVCLSATLFSVAGWGYDKLKWRRESTNLSVMDVLAEE